MHTHPITTFTRSIYSDFIHFALASLATGMVAAILLSSAVILLSTPKATAVEEVSQISGDGGMRARTKWAVLPGVEVAA